MTMVKLERRRGHVMAARKQGMPLPYYARERGISRYTLYAAQRQLRQQAQLPAKQLAARALTRRGRSSRRRCQGGARCAAGEKIVRLTRAHLEEDAGKSLHEDYHGMTGIDLNRAGTPLLEIVTEPDMRSAAEAVAYAKALHALVKWIGICDGNMQEGSFRCDANVSVRPAGETKLGTRCEIKNLNSFRFMQEAIDFEMRRQIELIGEGGAVVQETRLYDPGRGETRPSRIPTCRRS